MFSPCGDSQTYFFAGRSFFKTAGLIVGGKQIGLIAASKSAARVPNLWRKCTAILANNQWPKTFVPNPGSQTASPILEEIRGLLCSDGARPAGEHKGALHHETICPDVIIRPGRKANPTQKHSP